MSSELNVYQAARVVQLPPAAMYVLMKNGVIASRKARDGFYTTEDDVLGFARRWGGRLSAATSAHV
jgi:hypothetical protein